MLLIWGHASVSGRKILLAVRSWVIEIAEQGNFLLCNRFIFVQAKQYKIDLITNYCQAVIKLQSNYY